MSVLQIVQKYRAEQRLSRQENGIGADLIPRARPDDPRFAGVDLVARGQDLQTLRLGVVRLNLSVGDLSPDLRANAERIAKELKRAGSEEIGRWATDVLYAYADLPRITPTVEVAMYYAWALSVDASGYFEDYVLNT
jgi:Asp-tRNA(Asn)/Glu-tRNA(Gln) amidotransferase A subunit family amidase